jgi:hypothetical protein
MGGFQFARREQHRALGFEREAHNRT